jgi:predicted TIM-barrel fold metal-dependent hydrolase
MEFSTDSSRAIASWIVSGAAKRFPDIQWIYSHGGGSLVASRFLGGEGDNLRGEAKPDSRLYYLRKYYYDTIASNEATLGALKKTVEASQIVFGYFDIPRPRDVPAGDARKRFKALADTGVFTDAEIRGIAYQNALRLFPQYA